LLKKEKRRLARRFRNFEKVQQSSLFFVLSNFVNRIFKSLTSKKMQKSEHFADWETTLFIVHFQQ